ncbi:MAG: pseudouridine-5'-phosphate glycosidase, partial [Flavobacteriales bacterium]|nr:pseudouridine-5'-phosphate glycosidase [Flavobacteriales bacterium]
MIRNLLLNISDEVSDAQSEGRPIVALESTIIAHGMPFPENFETGRDLETIIRNQGAVPATIAVFDGKICVGLSNEQLHRLATEKCMKLSRRDLPFALAQKNNGATTVAATMIGAALAGIRVFATGGIGGVHRGAETSFDISADLSELAQTPVAVVCAGAKSMLDLPKTMEYLETQGVPVIGY